MIRIVSLLACASLLLSSVFCAPFSLNAPVVARNALAKRAEPQTGVDFPDKKPHPNNLDKVEGGFNDAIELASYALTTLAKNDNTILKHYFKEGDKDKVKKVFQTLIGTTHTPQNPANGNDKLGNIFVQTQDPKGRCKNGRTLAFMEDFNTDKPFIVLCPNVFKKKGVTPIKGAKTNPKDAKFYISCDELKANGHVSYLMNSLGATFLHEYLHYDNLFKPVVGSIIDQPKGYGPMNVYNKLDKTKALRNADSYMYFALENLFTILCKKLMASLHPARALMMRIRIARSRLVSLRFSFILFSGLSRVKRARIPGHSIKEAANHAHLAFSIPL